MSEPAAESVAMSEGSRRPTSPESVEGLFLEALALETTRERQALLDRVGQDDPLRRRRVEALLRAYDDAGSFLEQPAAPPPPEVYDFLSPTEKSGCLGSLGHYEVIDVIGRGGMGIVFRALDPRLNRIVAIKVLAPELAANPLARRRFLREAQAAAAISHPHVVTIHGVDEQKLPYLVMECVVGQSLQEKLDRVGPLRLTEILRIGAQVAEGLAAAHRQGLIHRDIKPANILLENGIERVKISDFGLARAADDAQITRTGEVAGTPQYMSPEQAKGERVDARSDLFSLGCLMYAMCTGRSPFRADSVAAAIRRVCEETPRPIEEVNPEIPAWLIDIINHLLAKNPEERFQTSEEVATALELCLQRLQRGATASSASSLRAEKILTPPPISNQSPEPTITPTPIQEFEEAATVAQIAATTNPWHVAIAPAMAFMGAIATTAIWSSMLATLWVAYLMHSLNHRILQSAMEIGVAGTILCGVLYQIISHRQNHRQMSSRYRWITALALAATAVASIFATTGQLNDLHDSSDRYFRELGLLILSLAIVASAGVAIALGHHELSIPADERSADQRYRRRELSWLSGLLLLTFVGWLTWWAFGGVNFYHFPNSGGAAFVRALTLTISALFMILLLLGRLCLGSQWGAVLYLGLIAAGSVMATVCAVFLQRPEVNVLEAVLVGVIMILFTAFYVAILVGVGLGARKLWLSLQNQQPAKPFPNWIFPVIAFCVLLISVPVLIGSATAVSYKFAFRQQQWSNNSPSPADVKPLTRNTIVTSNAMNTTSQRELYGETLFPPESEWGAVILDFGVLAPPGDPAYGQTMMGEMSGSMPGMGMMSGMPTPARTDVGIRFVFAGTSREVPLRHEGESVWRSHPLSQPGIYRIPPGDYDVKLYNWRFGWINENDSTLASQHRPSTNTQDGAIQTLQRLKVTSGEIQTISIPWMNSQVLFQSLISSVPSLENHRQFHRLLWNGRTYLLTAPQARVILALLKAHISKVPKNHDTFWPHCLTEQELLVAAFPNGRSSVPFDLPGGIDSAMMGEGAFSGDMMGGPVSQIPVALTPLPTTVEGLFNEGKHPAWGSVVTHAKTLHPKAQLDQICLTIPKTSQGEAFVATPRLSPVKAALGTIPTAAPAPSLDVHKAATLEGLPPADATRPANR